MGKGTIISGGEDGKYKVELVLSRDRLTDQITALNEKIALLEEYITQAESEIAQLKSDISSLKSEIAGMEPGPERDKKYNELIALQNELGEKISYKNVLILKKNACQKQIEYLQNNMLDDPTIEAWCGDYTEDLSGSVGTIEVPGERGIVLVQPGYEGNAVYNSIRDGQLEPSIVGTPSGTFYNLAMLPGWQKWKPTYRFGTISNIDRDPESETYNTCDVTLKDAISSQQNLEINQSVKLIGISIEYMFCDSNAFSDGDDVLVKFESQDWSNAKVIGFKEEPGSCDWFEDWEGETITSNHEWIGLTPHGAACSGGLPDANIFAFGENNIVRLETIVSAHGYCNCNPHVNLRASPEKPLNLGDYSGFDCKVRLVSFEPQTFTDTNCLADCTPNWGIYANIGLGLDWRPVGSSEAYTDWADYGFWMYQKCEEVDENCVYSSISGYDTFSTFLSRIGQWLSLPLVPGSSSVPWQNSNYELTAIYVYGSINLLDEAHAVHGTTSMKVYFSDIVIS